MHKCSSCGFVGTFAEVGVKAKYGSVAPPLTEREAYAVGREAVHCESDTFVDRVIERSGLLRLREDIREEIIQQWRHRLDELEANQALENSAVATLQARVTKLQVSFEELDARLTTLQNSIEEANRQLAQIVNPWGKPLPGVRITET